MRPEAPAGVWRGPVEGSYARLIVNRAAMLLVTSQALAVAWLVGSDTVVWHMSLTARLPNLIGFGVATLLAVWLIDRHSQMSALLALLFALAATCLQLWYAYWGARAFPQAMAVVQWTGDSGELLVVLMSYVLPVVWMATAWLCWRAWRAAPLVISTASISDAFD